MATTSTSSATNALVAELCAVLLRGGARSGHGHGGPSAPSASSASASSLLSALPEELVVAHCQGLVRVLREVEVGSRVCLWLVVGVVGFRTLDC